MSFSPQGGSCMNEATQAITALSETAVFGSASVGQRWGAVLSALFLFLLLYLVGALGTVSWWGPRRLVTGTDGRVSTSKFQWFVWIAAILFAYTALWVLRAEQGEFGALGVAPTGLLTVLGFSTGTAVAAKAITSTYVRNGRVTKTSVALPERRASGLFQDDRGAPDLAKIQMTVITLITIGIFLSTVIHQIVTSPGAVALPDIDTFLVVLAGLSQAGYLGWKLATADAPTWPAGALRNLPATRSWNLIGLTVVVLVVTAVVAAAVFGRSGLKQTASGGHWGGVLAFALLCSLISFAVLEMGKRLLPVRQFVQERYVLQWWAAQAEAAVVPAEESWTELMEALDIRSSVRSAFGLPIQLLAAQVSNAADQALTEPARHPLLYFAFTRSAEDARVFRNEFAQQGGRPVSLAPAAGESGQAEVGGSRQASGDQELLAAMAAEWEESRLPGASADGRRLLRTPGRAGADGSRDEDQAFQAGQRARGAIDSLQLAVGERWRRSVQAASVLAAALAGLLIQLARPSDTRWLYVVAAALIGGPLAWTIRDLAAAIERWRR